MIATGIRGCYLVPGGPPEAPGTFNIAACQLGPTGLDPLADSCTVWMVAAAGWQLGNPAFRVQYSCADQPAVVAEQSLFPRDQLLDEGSDVRIVIE